MSSQVISETAVPSAALTSKMVLPDAEWPKLMAKLINSRIKSRVENGMVRSRRL